MNTYIILYCVLKLVKGNLVQENQITMFFSCEISYPLDLTLIRKVSYTKNITSYVLLKNVFQFFT